MNIVKHGYQDMVLEYYVEKLRKMRQKRAEHLASLQSEKDARAYQKLVLDGVSQVFGPFPEKTPLNARVTGMLQCSTFHIEKVQFYSRPGFMATASLYLPDNITEKAPAVLGLCGHAEDGRFNSTYQQFALRLAMNDFVVLLVDPIHQGERYQYTGLQELGLGSGLCGAHNVMGKQLMLLGESMPTWRVWDAIRALDYLLERPEVDVSRVGVTGNSGGGTITEWLWANDARLAFAAPSCHVTTFMRNLEDELPTDAEQCPYALLANGLEMVDLMLCRAPKPAILLGQKYDFFERSGLKEAYSEMKRFYALFGAENNAELCIDDNGHGYSENLQLAMLHFFHDAAGLKGRVIDETPKPHSPEELRACSSGNVINEGSKPIYAIMSAMASHLAATRTPPKTAAEWSACLAKLLDLPQLPTTPPHFRVLRPHNGWARYAIETEDGIKAIMRKRLTHTEYPYTLDVTDTAFIYLPNLSSEADAAECPFVSKLNEGGDIYAIDARGLGESMPEDTLESFCQGYGMDYMMNSFGFMFRESYLGRRLYDVLRTITLLQNEGARSIKLAGRGQGALLATFAALLCPEIASVSLYGAPVSFKQWIDEKICQWPSANMPFGVLRYFDLPDAYAALGKRLALVRS